MQKNRDLGTLNYITPQIPMDFSRLYNKDVKVYWIDGQKIEEDLTYTFDKKVMPMNATLHIPIVCRFIYTWDDSDKDKKDIDSYGSGQSDDCVGGSIPGGTNPGCAGVPGFSYPLGYPQTEDYSIARVYYPATYSWLTYENPCLLNVIVETRWDKYLNPLPEPWSVYYNGNILSYMALINPMYDLPFIEFIESQAVKHSLPKLLYNFDCCKDLPPPVETPEPEGCGS